MTSSRLETAALVAMLVSLPLLSWGTTDGVDVATLVGALLLAAGLATLTLLRFIKLEEDA